MKNIIFNIIKITCIAALVIFVNCDGSEYDTPPSFTDLSITMTSGAGSIRESEVNRFFSFSDLSAGVLYREWRIPQNTFFLEGPIPNNLDNHDAYIKEPIESTSDDRTVHVLFKKGDSNTRIGYYAQFADSTSFVFNSYYDSEAGETVEDTIKTEWIDGKWIAEYYFTLDVYDTVVAKAEVRKTDGSIIDHMNTESITLMYGDKLVFEDLSNFVENNNARPDYTRWRLHTIAEDREDEVNVLNRIIRREGDLERRIIDTITFSRIGEFQMELLARRERTENLRASTDTLDIPMIIKVVPVDEDLVVSGPIVEQADDRIFVPINFVLEPLSDNPADDFTVKVDGVSIPVESVGINGSRLILTLDVPLEPADDGKSVTLSYNGTSIMSRDERLLQPFTDLDIKVYVPEPINLVGISELLDQTIQLDFDKNLNPDSLSGSESFFDISINNGAYSSTPSISSISLNADDASIVEIVLDETIYQNDTVTITLNTGGPIRGVGDGLLVAFNDVVVGMNEHLVFEEDFEGSSAENWALLGGNGDVTLSTEQAFSGSRSLKYTATDNSSFTQGQNTVDTYSLEAGSRIYILTANWYIAAGTTWGANTGYWPRFGGSNVAGAQFGTTDTHTMATDQWVQWERPPKTFTVPATSSDYYSFLRMAINGTVYVDDIKVVEQDLRP